MLFCRFCGTELNKNSSVCPSCGKDNDLKTIAGKKKLTKKQITTIIVSILVVAALIPAIYFGVKGIKQLTKPNDLYYKDNYSLSEYDILTHNDTVIATLGDYKLTNKQLQVFYWSRVYEFMDYAGNYASYYGLNYKLPLNEQVYDEQTGKSWQHMFLEQALTDWQNYAILAQEAKANNFQLPEKYQETLDTLEESLQENVKAAKMDSVDAYLDAYVAPNCTFADYKYYYEMYLTSNAYYNHLRGELEVTESEMDTFFSENAETLKSQYNVTKTSGDLNSVRHILIKIEGGTENEAGEKVYSDEDWEKCRKEAQEILDQWLAGDKTEESFSKLAAEKSEDTGSSANGGLYTGINKDTTFVKPFLNWCLDEKREVGDYELVKTTHGYHIMYFVDREAGWILYCRDGVKNEKMESILSDLTKESTTDINYKKIAIVYQPLV